MAFRSGESGDGLGPCRDFRVAPGFVERAEWSDDAQRELDIRGGDRVLEGGADVVEFVFDSAHPVFVVGPSHAVPRGLSELGKELGVLAGERLAFGLFQSFGAVSAHRFEQCVSGLADALVGRDERFVDEGIEPVKRGEVVVTDPPAYSVRGGESEAAGEYR